MLNISKPRGATSHQVVAQTRRLFQQKRVGHAGTLDPLAEGVLPVLLGRATRLADFVSNGDKRYYADVLLGTVTTTGDLEGETVTTLPVPELTDAQVLGVLAEFVGEINQLPPAYSAIKVAGVASYRRARRGEQVALPGRAVRIDEIRLVRRRPNCLGILVRCGKGTYIRALARDIGERLGCGATLARLVRLRVGDFELRDSVSPDDLEAAARLGQLEHHLLPPDRACSQLAAIVLDATSGERAAKGQGWPAEPGEAELVRTYTVDGAFLGLARREADWDGDANRSWWRLRLLMEDA